MIAVIKFKKDLRVVFILGQSEGKIYCLASEKIPSHLAPSLSRTMNSINDLGKKIATLKDQFAFIYRHAFRVFDSTSVKIVKTYDK